MTGDGGSNDPSLFTGSLLEGAMDILLDLMSDANEQDREILLGMLEAGEIDTFLTTVDDGSNQLSDTASIDIEINIDRSLTEGEQEAIEKLETFIAAVTSALNMLPDNAQIRLTNGEIVTAGELKNAWASTDFRIDDTDTRYDNQSMNSEAVYHDGNPQININIAYLDGISDLDGGVEWFVLHELAHFSEASLQDRSTTIAESIANAPIHELRANEIAAALAETFGITIFTDVQYGFDGDPARFTVPTGGDNSNGSNDDGSSSDSSGPGAPGGVGGSGGASGPDLHLY